MYGILAGAEYGHLSQLSHYWPEICVSNRFLSRQALGVNVITKHHCVLLQEIDHAFASLLPCRQSSCSRAMFLPSGTHQCR